RYLDKCGTAHPDVSPPPGAGSSDTSHTAVTAGDPMHAARHARAVHGPSGRRALLLGAGAVVAVATTALLVAGRGAETANPTPTCPRGPAPLVVSAAPEIAPVVADVLRVAGAAPAP